MPEPAKATLYRVEQPMATSFDHPAKRRSTSDSLLLRLEVDGVTGLGECAPRAYVTGETSDSVASALREVPLDAVFARLRAAEPAELLARLRESGVAGTFGVRGAGNLLCLLETALLDLLGRRLGLGGTELVECRKVLTGALPVSQVLDLSLDVEEFLDTRGPFHFVKVKAGADIRRDAATVRAIRGRLGDKVPVMVDANMSWSAEEAAGHLAALCDAGADWVEEPLAKGSWIELAELRARSGLRIMLDESVCTPEEAWRAVTFRACDAFNIRVAKNGGPITAARLIALARAAGLAFQIGVQVAEVGPLINAGRALAFAHPEALTVEAGQWDRFFPEMVVSPRPVVDRTTNTVAPAPGPGFGLELNERAAAWAVARRIEGDPSWRPATPPTRTEVRA
ncbi:L-alanine-DL-glutamate epimerase-like enolase superfamily enzyme [Kitasatospora sp. GP30]|uniref:enolase C-terminal domain-like protein n=1 Tax=Kitasatospora sp. GP30 TaxID=3035084 RepID=UPI000C70B136|nr:enolase C-terminal domain-like protein [Kitasatospora sp. GP30]MDH6144572.1 L-alanine-DL-glutamate epimerase-like enolase superfamily enzyme [Kitasatospora sp. GP30]